MKRITVASAALLAIACSAVFATAAHSATFNSTISIGKTLPIFHGKVRSRLQSECEPDRRVILYRKVPGNDVRVGRDRTNIAGKWKIEPDELKPGQKFYAVVRQQRLGNDINCAPDTSIVMTFVGD